MEDVSRHFVLVIYTGQKRLVHGMYPVESIKRTLKMERNGVFSAILQAAN